MTILAYLIYFIVMAFIIVRVGWLFYHHGQVYMDRLFSSDLNYGRWVNKLLLKAYYLFNLGYVAMSISSWTTISDLSSLLEVVASALGTIILILAVMHYLNLIWLQLYSRWKFERATAQKH